MSPHNTVGIPRTQFIAGVALASLFGLAACATPGGTPTPDTTGGVTHELDAVAESLSWQGSSAATYEQVVPAVNSAITAIEGADGIPQQAVYREMLERLRTEAAYLLDLSSADGYEPGVLDSEMFLIGAVDEWQHTIATMRDRLSEEAPSTGTSVESTADVSDTSAPGTSFKDHPEGPELVIVPGGSYVAGAAPGEHELWAVPEARRDFETPQREVTIPAPIAFGATEVTVEQFQAFVNDTGYEVRGGARWWDPSDPTGMIFDASLDYTNPGFEQEATSPAMALTRQDAEAYTAWLSETTGHTYRLPTEDEWEWAARAGTQTTFPWGEDIAEVGQYANSYDVTASTENAFGWGSTPAEDGFAATAPVASFEPNAFGLYDMIGNAREFTADDWVRDLSDASTDGSAHAGDEPFPVLRGGAWNYQPQNLRTAYRSAYFSSEVATNMFGFRVVREL